MTVAALVLLSNLWLFLYRKPTSYTQMHLKIDAAILMQKLVQGKQQVRQQMLYVFCCV